jgi:hypothetical protein
MIMKKIFVLLVVLALAVPALAQVTQTRPPEETAGEAEAAATREPTVLERLKERIRKASRLPEAAGDARDAGIPDEEVEKVITEARRRRMPPAEVEAVLVESAASARENGPVDNFGAFVQSQLDQGLRGRELAEAIHREHAAHGKGPMKAKSKGKGNKSGKGKMKKDKDKDGYIDDDDHDEDHDREGEASSTRTKGRDGQKRKDR